VYRDEWGTPHVYGADFRAMAFAFGYAQAQDHLEPMLAAYRVANGRAAEAFGEPFAESDAFALKMGHAALAHRVFDGLDPVTQDLCEGFATGVNAWLVEHPERAPVWADGARPEDPLALLHCYLMSFAPFDLEGPYHRSRAAVSGNAWAVGPPRSETAEALLVINPHTAYDGPFQWYEAHLACGDMNVAGATLFGLPVILQGHNAVLGWALAPNEPDFADVYIEPPLNVRRDPKSVMRRSFPGPEVAMQHLLATSARTFFVATPDGPVPREVVCFDTPRGPLIDVQGSRLFSYQVGGYGDFGTMAQLVDMARAQDLPSFEDAVAMHQLPCFHILYADREGNISYLYNVKVGDKFVAEGPPPPPQEAQEGEEQAPEAEPPPLIDWTIPLPAAAPLFAWGEVIAVEDLPSVTNPASGYLQACGNPPWAVTDGLAMAPEDFPPWFAQDLDSFRARRVRRLLRMGKRSFRDCQTMLYDVVVPFAAGAVPQLVALAEARADFVANAHPDLAVGIDLLDTWNRLAETNSVGMTFFHAWWSHLRMQAPEVYRSDGELFEAFAAKAPDVTGVALEAAAEAARLLRNEHQSLSVPWGEVHTVRRGTREVPMPGAMTGEPVFTASDFIYDNRKWRVTYGYGFAMVVAFGDKPRAVSVAPFGASENPASPHFADQLDLMAERRFKVTRFDHEDVQRHAASARGRVLYLRPQGVEAVVTLHAEAPVEARLETSTASPTELPEGLVPFTLFVEVQKSPRETAVDTQLQVYIPPVLCARAHLEHLAIHAYDAVQGWARLEPQQLDTEQRTFTGFDNGHRRTYAVLGPQRYRVTRLPIPGASPSSSSSPSPTPSPPTPEPPEETPPVATESLGSPPIPAVEASPERPDGASGGRVFWGAPEKVRRLPRLSPPGAPEGPPIEGDRPPEIDITPLVEEQEDTEGEGPEVPEGAPRVQRNFNLDLLPQEKSSPRQGGRKGR